MEMTVKNAAADVLAAVSVMQHASAISRRLNPLSDPMTLQELQQRADMIDKVIRARAKLQQLRNRAAALEEALTRFRTQRERRCA
jgi:hypothetical protein